MLTTENTEAHAYFVVLIWTTVSVGAALAANNPSDCDEFAAEAAPTKLKASVFSVTSVANFFSYQPTKPVKDPTYLNAPNSFVLLQRINRNMLDHIFSN